MSLSAFPVTFLTNAGQYGLTLLSQALTCEPFQYRKNNEQDIKQAQCAPVIRWNVLTFPLFLSSIT